MLAGIIIGGIVLLLAIWAIATYNRLVNETLKVENQWSQIDIILKQRADVIPNLVSTVSGYAAHAKQLLEHVSQVRSRYLSAGSQQEAIQASQELSGFLGRLKSRRFLKWISRTVRFQR